MPHFHAEHTCCGGAKHHHEHSHHHGHTHSGEAPKSATNLLVAMCLNLGFALIELIGGIYTGSVAILSDALHDFGDSVSLGFAWYLERLSVKGRDKHFSYGYKRFSLLSALLISLLLLLGSLVMIYTAIAKIFAPEPVHATGVFYLAILGVLVNGLAAWRMWGSTSLSDRALRLHLLEDILGWVAILVMSVVMYFTNWAILDPILSICISLWILYNVYFNLRDTFRILLQGVPEDVDSEGFERELRRLEAVLDVHDLHLWTMNGQEHIASLHLVHSPKLCHDPRAAAELKREVRHIAEHYGLKHITIELDAEGESCGMECC